jgi:putative NIF3 family GTP cyclohydrolase 1 type 2
MNYADVTTRLLSQFAPDKLQPGEWGFLNEQGEDIRKIGYATNLTPEVIGEAVMYGADFIVTHHDAWDFVYGMKDACRSLLERHGIAHAFFHAPLDDADFGTGASLAAALGLINCRRAVPVGIYTAGVVGELPEALTFMQLTSNLSGVLGEPVRAYRNNGRTVGTVCVTTGGGMMTNDMKWAAEEHCDAYVTGEYMLYSQQYARFTGMDLFIGSHTYTEIFGVKSLVERLIDGTDMTAVRLYEENY